MARPKKYIIRLSDDEIATLQRTIKNKATCKTVLKRCQILLELDEIHGTGLTHATGGCGRFLGLAKLLTQDFVCTPWDSYILMIFLFLIHYTI